MAVARKKVRIMRPVEEVREESYLGMEAMEARLGGMGILSDPVFKHLETDVWGEPMEQTTMSSMPSATTSVPDTNVPVKEEKVKPEQQQEVVPGLEEALQDELPASGEEQTEKTTETEETEQPAETSPTEQPIVTQEEAPVEEGAEKGSGERLTEMAEPSLDGGVERMKVLDKSILDSTKQKNESAAEETQLLQEEKILSLGTDQKQKDDAPTKMQKTVQAVEETSEEKQSEVNAKQVVAVEEITPPVVEEQTAQTTLTTKIEAALPQKMEEVNKFKDENKATDIGNAVLEVVENKTQEITGTFEQLETTEKPDAPKTATPLPSIEEAPVTPELNLGENLIEPVEKEATDLSKYVEESDNLLQREGITEEQLNMVDSGPLAEVKAMREEIKANETEVPAEVKAEETKLQEEANAELKEEEAKKREEMTKTRETELGDTLQKQQRAKLNFEKKKLEVTNHINGLYETANQQVQEKLAGLQDKASAAFDEEQKKASTAFETELRDEFAEWKRNRYSDLGGKLTWLGDRFRNINEMPEVVAMYEKHKNAYMTRIDAAITSITAESQLVIDECKGIITKARTDIQTYVDGLSPALQKIGKDAQKEITQKLDALDQKINEEAIALKEALAVKREKAIAEMEQKLEKIREENKTELEKGTDKIKDGAFEFFKWTLEKAGVKIDDIMPIINKGKAVLTSIVDDPGLFLSNLWASISGGVSNFMSNALTHLQTGLFNWLTGAMSGVPIQLPEQWDLKGIFSFVAQLLGLGWDTIKEKLGKKIGEDKIDKIESAVAAGEEGLGAVKKVKEEGLAGATEMIQGEVEQIKETAKGEISNWVIMTIITSGIPQLIAMLNPAGGIVALYKIIMWFVNNFQRLINFVQTVFDAVASIASGVIDKAMKGIESALAQTIPIIIDFLAQLLGLSGIGKAVKGIIAKIRKPVDKIVDKVVNWVADKAKKLLAKLGVGKKRSSGKPDNEGLVNQGVIIDVKEFDVGKEHHKLYVDNSGEVVVESKKTRLEKALDRYKTKKNEAKIEPTISKGKRLRAIAKKLKTTTSDIQKRKLEKEAESLEDEIVLVLKGMMFGTNGKMKEKMDPVTIPFALGTKKKEAYKEEFERQLNIQQAEIRSMNVGEWQTRRAKFVAFGRDKEDTGTERKAALIQKLIDNPTDAILALHSQKLLTQADAERVQSILDNPKVVDKKTFLSYYATTIMNKYGKKKLNVLHSLDQVAGGLATKYGDEKTIFGAADVNQEIGRQWKDRIYILDNAVKGVKPESKMEDVTLKK